MSSPTNVSQPEEKKSWTIPLAPPLYKAQRRDKPEKRVPLMIFGWAYTVEDQLTWADHFGITHDTNEVNRAHMALRKVLKRMPPSAKGPVLVSCKLGGVVTVAACIYVGSNVSQEDMARAQNEELINE
ncbi:hypothetical protein BJ912DRAFT_1038852, partial [Pholiota molesta]